MTGIAERPTIVRSKQALSSRQRSSIRQHLESDREQTRAMLERINYDMAAFVSARNDAPTDDEHDPEGPTLAFERSQASAMRAQAEQHMLEIEHALTRMDDGKYGLCARCGGEIAIGRLQVRPQASLCIRCAETVR
jgi:DnaK suppressor protein